MKENIKDLCVKLVISIQPFLVNMFHTQMGVGTSNKNVFHIFGIDILVDKRGKPWLLEINANPSLNMFYDKIEGGEKVKTVSKLD